MRIILFMHKKAKLFWHVQNLLQIFMILLLILNAAFVSATDVADRTDLNIVLLNQEPDPVQPGEVVEVRFKIENLGKQTIEDLIVEIMPDYPFSLYTSKASRNFGKLNALQTGGDAVIVDYKLKVDEKAVEGENEIELRFKVGENAWQVYDEDEFMIDIQSRDIVLAVEDIAMVPEKVYPGSTVKLKFKLKNTADSVIKDAKIKLGISSSNLPFASFKSITEKTVKTIDTAEVIELEFDLMVDASAESKLYKIPVIMEYSDERGNKYYKNSSTALLVYSEPELQIDIEKSTILQKEPIGNIVFSIANKGVSKINYLNIEVLPSDDYMVIPDSTIYIGNLDPDDYESAEFTIHVLNQELKEVSLKLLATYKNAYNEDESKKLTIPLKLYTTEEAIQMKLVERPTMFWWLIAIIILAIVAYFGYREWKKYAKK